MINHYIEVYDLNLKRIAYFDTALNVVETVKINQISTLTFELPAIDPKIDLCQLRYFVDVNGGEKYRIMDRKVKKSDITMIEFECEHALATLVDDVMFGEHVIGNIGTYTDEVINYILSFQTTARWTLKNCGFQRQFEYGWTSENLLSALFSVPTPITDLYMWQYDTTVYPWELSLVEIDPTQRPQFYIMDGLNLRESENHEQSSTIFTRIYPLGYGEGVNQLGISKINNGVPYVEASAEAISKYGLIQAVWTDRRYESAENLLAAAQVMVNDLSQPYYQYTVGIADLYELRGGNYRQTEDPYRAAVGRIVKFEDGFITYITQTTRRYDVDGDMDISVANKVQTVATSLADLADRQRIEATYSQGATQLWGSPIQDNASPDEPLTYMLWIPDETKIMNKVMLKVAMSNFRAYSATTDYAGGTTQTSSAGGGIATSTEYGGGVSTSTESGGASVQTSGASSKSTSDSSVLTSQGTASGTSTQKNPTTGDFITAAQTGTIDHYHTMNYPPIHYHGMAHTHSVNVPAHTHDFEVPTHSHQFTLPDHEHDVTIPAHRHEIDYGIFYAPDAPTSAQVLIGGTLRLTIGTEYEGDITEYLVNSDGEIPRGQFLEISVKPDKIAHITISVAAQGFIQSRGGGQY